MKKLIIISLFSVFFSGLMAQQNACPVPQNYILEKASDYKAYEKDVTKCVNWLIETPSNQDIESRKAAWQFILKWIDGSPDVMVYVTDDFITFLDKKQPELLLVFMGGWSKSTIATGDKDNIEKNALAAIEDVITYYEKNKEIIGKNKAVEKYIKLKEKGELKKTVEEKAEKLKESLKKVKK
jgi:hypothetical protein